MSKRPAVESIPLCCNASVKGGEHFIKNKISSYSMDETWEDVLKDLLEDSNFIFGKADTENIKLSNVKKKKKSLPTYPPADSVGRQCQTNNILRVALSHNVVSSTSHLNGI